MPSLYISGRFRYEIWSPDKLVCASRWSSNGIITATINDLFDVYFSNGAPQAAWYLGLIADTGFTALAATDTMASHAGWTEAVGYSGSRPAWAPGNAANGVKTNPTAAEFTITTEEALRGMFVTSNNTKGGTTGTLWATGAFDAGSTTVPAGQTLKLFYELEGREG